ncbi:MAG TPA: response regulator [Candidatus Aphodomonas merdavium]|nr:response regulator [Candidatus Aphodomonas merdavium]
MYSAVLCDDNEIILEGLKAGIDWKSLGIDVIGTAADGQEARQLMERQLPDILITDIRMPLLDGLELTRWAKGRNEQMAVVIISGYDDFQYARQAVRLGVIDYVLKPIDMEEFLGILQKVVARCGQARQMHRYTAAALLRAAAHAEMSDEALERECKRAQLDCGAWLCMVLIELGREHYAAYPEAVRYELEKKLLDFGEAVQRKGGYVTDQSGARLGFFLVGRDRQEVLSRRDEAISAARRFIRSDTLQAEVTLAVSDVFEGIRMAGQCAAQCETAMGYRFLTGLDSTIFYSDIADYSQLDLPAEENEEELDEQLTEAVKRADEEEAGKVLYRLAGYLRQKGGESYLYMMLRVSRLFARLESALFAMGEALSNVFDDPLLELKHITTRGNLDGAMAELEKTVMRLCQYLKSRQSRYSKPVATAMTYIKDHYSQSELSIEDVAAAIYLSTAHFSTLFKNETGVTFTDYLISIRMENAMRMLTGTDQKIYEISVACGYDSAAYFSSAFKKYTGMSPSEFKVSQGGWRHGK